MLPLPTLMVLLACVTGHVAAAAGTTIFVSNSNADGPGSLRQAMLAAAGTDDATIDFSRMPAGETQIRPTTSLPDMGSKVHIDGSTHPAFRREGPPVVVIDGSSAGRSSGLTFVGKDVRGSIVQSLEVRRFQGSGFVLVSRAVTVESCHVLENNENGVVIR